MGKRVEPARQTDALAVPREIFNLVKGKAIRKNKSDNLDLLWSVLMELREAGSRDYSLSEVGRRLEEKGGLKTQSLRNAGGADFRDVIGAFAQSVMGSPRYVAKTKSSVDQALDLITDPSLRAVLKEEIARAKKYREENATLRNAFSKLSIPTAAEVQISMGPVTTLPPTQRATLEVATPSSPDSNPALSLLGEDLLGALQRGISKASLRKNGFKVNEDGSIWNERYELFPRGFITACRAILAAHGKEPQ